MSKVWRPLKMAPVLPKYPLSSEGQIVLRHMSELYNLPQLSSQYMSFKNDVSDVECSSFLSSDIERNPAGNSWEKSEQDNFSKPDADAIDINDWLQDKILINQSEQIQDKQESHHQDLYDNRHWPIDIPQQHTIPGWKPGHVEVTDDLYRCVGSIESKLDSSTSTVPCSSAMPLSKWENYVGENISPEPSSFNCFKPQPFQIPANDFLLDENPLGSFPDINLEENVCQNTHCPTTEPQSEMISLSEVWPSQEDSILEEFSAAYEIILCCIYTDGTTSFSTNMKDQKAETLAFGILHQAVSKENLSIKKIYGLPLQTQETERKLWYRHIIKNIMETKCCKLAFDVKEIVKVILQYNLTSSSKETSKWKILDIKVAVWLLQSDEPIMEFDRVMEFVGLHSQHSTVAPDNIEALKRNLCLVSQAMFQLFSMLNRTDIWSLFFYIETRLPPLLADMELNKIKIDTKLLNKYSKVLQAKLGKLEKSAEEIVGHPISLRSPCHLREVLFDELHLDKQMDKSLQIKKTMCQQKLSTSEAMLNQLVDLHPLPAVILQYRQFQKLKSTYVDGILSCQSDNYISTHWDQMAAATGRLTSAQPNIQAFPKSSVTIENYKDSYIIDKESTEKVEISAREAFVSHEGFSLLAVDFQHIELRLLAHLSQDPLLLELFQHDNVYDVFISLTSLWLSKPLNEISQTEREQTKRVIYSIMYGIGKGRLSEYLKLSKSEAEEIISNFLRKFSSVNKFFVETIKFCQNHGFTCTIFKRRRMIPNINHTSMRLKSQAERQAFNFCVQGSAADLCKAAMLQIERTLLEEQHLETRLLFQIHDELLFEVPDDKLGQIKDIVEKVMQSATDLCGNMVQLTVPLKVSTNVGKSWGQMKDTK